MKTSALYTASILLLAGLATACGNGEPTQASKPETSQLQPDGCSSLCARLLRGSCVASEDACLDGCSRWVECEGWAKLANCVQEFPEYQCAEGKEGPCREELDRVWTCSESVVGPDL